MFTIVLLITTLALLAFFTVGMPWAFSRLGLSERGQALGLPDGSVRAVLAVALLLLFVAAPLYMFTQLLPGAQTIEGVSDADVANLKQDPSIRHLIVVPKDGKNTVYFDRAPDAASFDFAKDMKGILGTLVTSVISFYFGAKVATSAASQGAAQAGGGASRPPPVLRALSADPAASRDAAGLATFTLTLTGSGLNDVKTVKLASGPDRFVFDSLSSDTTATCAVRCTPTVPAGAAWDVTVIDAMGTESAPLTGSLSF